MRFTVCIAATRADCVGRAVASVLGQTWADWDLLVVGQGDELAVRAAVAAAAGDDPRVRFVHQAGRGLSRARNLAARLAGGEVLAFTDDDCEADPEWLAALAAGFARGDGDRVGLVAGAVAAPPATRRLSTCPAIAPADALYDPRRTPRRPPPGWDWMGANFAVRRDVLARLGGWDELLGAGTDFPAGEDTDFKIRLEAAGVPMVTTPAAVVRHAAGRREGVRAVLRSQRGYARGNGATAAKMSLGGDARGRSWLVDTWRDCLLGWLRQRRPHRLPADLRRLWFFSAGYLACRRGCQLDAAGMLRRRGTAVPATPGTPMAATPGVAYAAPGAPATCSPGDADAEEMSVVTVP
jgi:GT2 family glycosyltransferase